MPRPPARRHAARVLAALLLAPLALPLATSTPAVAAPGDPTRLEVLSGRGDLITDGNSLIRASFPAGTDLSTVVFRLNGVDVSNQFSTAADGTVQSLLTGLSLGANELTATLPDATGARITLTDHPIGGPVFSGPQILPWTCNNGGVDAQCNRDATITYSYISTEGGGFQAYDPDSPPSDVAMTTTDDGNTVPFIVRVETGASMRDEYRIAALYDPTTQGETPDPLAENPGYNNKVVLTHGVSCDTAYQTASAPNVLFQDALGQGFAVGSHALDNAGHNCNMVTQAESLIVTKELIAERFGPIRYTIGSGCSGGSLVQQQIANSYPGVYQGITPQCSFTDAWSSAQQYVDYVGLRRYLESPAGVLAVPPATWPSIYGHANPANQITFTTAIPNSGDPSRSCPGVPAAQVFTTASQTGVRCSFQDYMINVFGPDEAGKAHRPISNEGIQYGLSGLLNGLGVTPNTGDPTRPPLTAAQFVALNANVGGFDIDFEPTAARTQGDPVAQDRVYRSGAVNTGAHLDEVAIIDLGGPEPGAFHDVYRKFTLRDRLIREHGTSENQVFWEGQTPLLGDASFVDDSITAMDEWLAVVEADTRAVPLSQKIIDAKAVAGIERRCVGADGIDQPSTIECEQAVGATLFSSPRIEAGGGDTVVGFTDDRLDCDLIPIEEFDYNGATFAAVFTAPQQATLKTAFPDGVCDYSTPGKGFQAATTWLTYQDDDAAVIYGGEPMGAAPESIAFGDFPGAVIPEVPVAVLLPLAALAVGGALVARRRSTV